jgi:ATP-binding protein involved in chromosome partitioning
MFERMSVPILGVVENMSVFLCPHCGEASEIFGRGGAERFAAVHGLHFFGGIPLDMKVRQGGDAGVPAVAQREPGPAAQIMREVARAVAGRVSMQTVERAPTLTIS